MNLDQLTIRLLERHEMNLMVDWAVEEGWNPGLHDAEIFWRTDPKGFLGVELEGELIAVGSIVSYGGQFGFMGFFIVRQDLRGKGIGTKLWFHRRDALIARLNQGAAIAMDGVFDMQDWYGRGGFVLSHRNLRMQGVGEKSLQQHNCVSIKDLPFEKVAAFDLKHFAFPREEFLRMWIQPEAGRALAVLKDDQLVGYGVVRECVSGFKIGPLFADDPMIAEQLFSALSDHAAEQSLVLDVPEVNAEAMKLAQKNGMKEVFGCARMYYGEENKASQLPWGSIYGITTFELG